MGSWSGGAAAGGSTSVGGA